MTVIRTVVSTCYRFFPTQRDLPLSLRQPPTRQRLTSRSETADYPELTVSDVDRRKTVSVVLPDVSSVTSPKQTLCPVDSVGKDPKTVVQTFNCPDLRHEQFPQGQTSRTRGVTGSTSLLRVTPLPSLLLPLQTACERRMDCDDLSVITN